MKIKRVIPNSTSYYIRDTMFNIEKKHMARLRIGSCLTFLVVLSLYWSFQFHTPGLVGASDDAALSQLPSPPHSDVDMARLSSAHLGPESPGDLFCTEDGFMLPSVQLVQAQKCGTSTLAKMLLKRPFSVNDAALPRAEIFLQYAHRIQLSQTTHTIFANRRKTMYGTIFRMWP